LEHNLAREEHLQVREAMARATVMAMAMETAHLVPDLMESLVKIYP